MTVTELYDFLSAKIPTQLSEEWDNDGKMLISSDKDISKVLISLDITPETVNEAILGEYDLILTHHPLIFKPIKGITNEKFVSLIRHGISVFSFHTRLDSVEGGVNDALAELLELDSVIPFEDMGRMGTLKKEMDAKELALYVKEKLGCPNISYTAGSRNISTVALLGGGGKDFWQSACLCADAYITGEMSHNTFLDAYEKGFTVIEAGHYYTEFPVCKALERLVKEADAKIEAKILNFYPVRTL